MASVDFVTVLGRLLHDGELRDAFAADRDAVAGRMGVRENDRTAFLQLVTSDLEFQARVILRKRFEVIRRLLPCTCERLGDEGWPAFLRYGRTALLAPKNAAAEDAVGFCQHLNHARPEVVWPVEFNRARFAQSPRKFACHFVRAIPSRRNRRPGLQFFVSLHPGSWHEWLVYLGG